MTADSATIFWAVAPDIAKFVNGIIGTADDLIGKDNWLLTAKDMVTSPGASLESILLLDGEASYKVYLAVYAM